jgi:DNA helicase HerA-like ATPase
MVERVMVRPPTGRIGPITPEERKAIMARSPVKGKYDTTIDSESAYEVLQKRVAGTAAPAGTAAGGTSADAPAGGSALDKLTNIVGMIFGTNRPRGQRLSTGQVLARNVTRSVTNTVIGGVAANLGKSVGGSLGGSVGRSLVRGTLGSLLKR